MSRSIVLSAMLAGSLSAITIGQTDTFSLGTTEGWFVPGASPDPPVHIATGGPGGSGDGYLQITARGGGGPGSRLSVLNEAQWSGDYTGLMFISMDVRNFGPEDLYLRLLIEDFAGGGPPVNLALTDAVFVQAGSDWQRAQFAVNAASMHALFGSAEEALRNVDTLRIFHNPDPDFPGPGTGIPPVNVVLGVDNITAVPEPGTAALVTAAAVLALVRLRSRRSLVP